MDEHTWVQRIRVARAKALRYRIVVGVAALVIFGSFGWSLAKTVSSFDDEALVERLNHKAARDVWPVIATELQRLGDEVTPIVAERFADNVQQAWPKVEKVIELESIQLGNNLQRMPETVAERLGVAVERETRGAVARAFPMLAEAERDALVRDAHGRIHDWSHKTVGDAIGEHIDALAQIRETLTEYQRTGTDAPTEISAEQVMALVLEVIEIRLSDGDPTKKEGVDG